MVIPGPGPVPPPSSPFTGRAPVVQIVPKTDGPAIPVTGNGGNPVIVENLPGAPLEVYGPSGLPVEVATPTGAPLQVATPAGAPLQVATPAGAPLQVFGGMFSDTLSFTLTPPIDGSLINARDTVSNNPQIYFAESPGAIIAGTHPPLTIFLDNTIEGLVLIFNMFIDNDGSQPWTLNIVTDPLAIGKHAFPLYQLPIIPYKVATATDSGLAIVGSVPGGYSPITTIKLLIAGPQKLDTF